MTRVGVAALATGLLSIAAAVWLRWPAFALLGVGLVALVLYGLVNVLRPSSLSIERQIQPPRVPKGEPAIAFLRFANTGRSRIGRTVASQPFGALRVRTVIPRLRRGQHGVRTYRLPTSRRGIFDVGPVEVTRSDPFDLFRASRRHGRTERIWVYPRVLPLRALPSGLTRQLDGPTSDTAPQGSITFHRLREYVQGDDLRLVHWRSSARTGTLVVRHNVDTSQPYTVVLLDLRPAAYTEESFESAIDVAASVLVSASADKSPVELRLTDGTVLGGSRFPDVTPLIDHLTGQSADPAGSLQEQLLRLRRARGGTSLVVITGQFDGAALPYVAGLRRRFQRLVIVCLNDTPVPGFRGVRIISAPDAEAACLAWNTQAR